MDMSRQCSCDSCGKPNDFSTFWGERPKSAAIWGSDLPETAVFLDVCCVARVEHTSGLAAVLDCSDGGSVFYPGVGLPKGG